MERTLREYIKRFQKNHRNGRRYIAVLLILAVITVLVVNWDLRGIGIAVTADYECGMEEHVHDKDCYELVCEKNGKDGDIIWSELDEDADMAEPETEPDEDQDIASPSDADKNDSGDGTHIHTKKCYKLVCELPEHVHTSKCMSDITSNTETQDDWESTLPEFTGDENQAQRMVAAAESQLGYHESEDNFKLADDGVTKQGYTRYGEWYGNPYGNWSAMFAAFVLHYAGVSKVDFPVNSGCQAWSVELKQKKLYENAGAYEPNYGDIAFLDLDGDSQADHTGIVADMERDEDEKLISVTAIVGDLDDEVEEAQYEVSEPEILGYGVLPENRINILPTDDTSQKLEDAADQLEVILYKKVGSEWQEVADNGTVNDQDEIKISIKYSIPANKVTDENRTLLYQLPEGIYPKEFLSGKITGKIAENDYDDLGTYMIDENGLVKFVFNDQFISNNAEFKGGLEMVGKASLKSDSTGEKIKFTTDGKTYTILPKEEKSDLTVKKEVTKIEDGKLCYTITAKSESGTKDAVKVQDWLAWSGLKNVTAQDPTVKKDNVDVIYDKTTDYTVSLAENDGGSGHRQFELTLPRLGAGEIYTITYLVEYGEVSSKDGASWIGNTAKGFDGSDQKSESRTQTEISKKMIDKTGSKTDNNNAVEWTIRVNPEKWADAAGTWNISDILNGETFDLSAAENLRVIKEDGNNIQTDVTEKFLNNSGTIQVEAGCSYTITYKTPVDFGTDTSKKYTNTVYIDDGDHHYSADSSETVRQNDEFKEKKAADQTQEDTDLIRQLWTITLDPKKGSEDALELTDTMLDKRGEIDPTVHWTTKEALESALVELEKEAIQWELTCYDENGVEVSDNGTKVTKFALKLMPESSWNGNAVTISYNSWFSIEGIAEGDSFQVVNRAQMNGVDHDATAVWEKKKRLYKYVMAADPYGNQVWHSGAYDVDYDAIKNELTYRIIVVPESNENDLVVEDVLPVGMLFKDGSVDIKFTEVNNHASNSPYILDSYDIRSEEHKPDIQIDGNHLIVTIKSGFPQRAAGGKFGFAIDYTVEIDDSFWNDLGNTEKNYENIVSWNGRNESQDTTVKHRVPVVEKDGVQVEAPDTGAPSRDIQYWVTINQAGKRLNGGKPLTLYDNLVTNGVSVSLDPNHVKLYSYDRDKEADHYKGQLLTSSAFQFQFDTEKKQLTVIVPDETPCVLEYIYTVENMNNKTAATFSNSAELTGSGETTAKKDIQVVEADSSAWVIKSDQLTIIKVDADRYQVTLPGAEFQLEELQNSDSWIAGGSYTTGDDGTCRISLSATDRDQLYRITETKAPDGYEKNGKPYYIVPLGANTTKDNWINSNKWKLNSLNISQSEITFIEYDGYDVLYVPNEMTTLKVVKMWQNNNGEPVEGSKEVKVQLYRNIQMLDCKNITVRFVDYTNTVCMEKRYQVKPETEFSFQLTGWSNGITVNDGKKDEVMQETNGEIHFVYTNVTDDTTFTVKYGWRGMESWDGFKAYYTPAEWKTESSEAAGDPVTLTPNNGYSYAWENLQKQGDDGKLYYYTVEEVDPSSGYTVIYMNNEGIQCGEIAVTNRKETGGGDYTLPETGGTGTIPFRTAGLAIISLALLSNGILRRRGKGEN